MLQKNIVKKFNLQSTKNFFFLFILYLILFSFSLDSIAQCRNIGNGYSVTEIGTLGGDISEGYDINNSGVVVGYSTTHRTGNPDNKEHAFFFKDGVIKDFAPQSSFFEEFNSVTESGNYLRRVYRLGGFESFNFTHSPDGGSARIFPPIACDSLGFRMFKLNASGYAVGEAFCGPSLNKRVGVAYTNLKSESLEPSGIETTSGINEKGVLIGTTFRNSQNENSAVLLDLSKTARTPNIIPAVPNFPSSRGIAINNSGNFVVKASNADGDVGVFYNGQNSTIIKTNAERNLVSPTDINSSNQVVGGALFPEGLGAFLWQNGSITNLNCLVNADVLKKWKITSASAINDKGQIVVNASYAGADRFDIRHEALLLTPIVREPISRPSGRILAQNKTQLSISLSRKGALKLTSKISKDVQSCTIKVNLAKSKEELSQNTETVKTYQFTQGQRNLKVEKQIDNIVSGKVFYSTNPYCSEIDSSGSKKKPAIRRISVRAPAADSEVTTKSADEFIEELLEMFTNDLK